MNILKSASKIGGFLILVPCVLMAAYVLICTKHSVDYVLDLVKYGGAFFTFLVVPKTGFQVLEKIYGGKNK